MSYKTEVKNLKVATKKWSSLTADEIDELTNKDDIVRLLDNTEIEFDEKDTKKHLIGKLRTEILKVEKAENIEEKTEEEEDDDKSPYPFRTIRMPKQLKSYLIEMNNLRKGDTEKDYTPEFKRIDRIVSNIEDVDLDYDRFVGLYKRYLKKNKIIGLDHPVVTPMLLGKFEDMKLIEDLQNKSGDIDPQYLIIGEQLYNLVKYLPRFSSPQDVWNMEIEGEIFRNNSRVSETYLRESEEAYEHFCAVFGEPTKDN